MRVPATPYHGSIGIDEENEHDPPRTGIWSAVIPLSAIACLGIWALGTTGDDWVSMGVPSDGSYGIPAGVIYGYPVTCKNGDYQIVQGLSINEFSRARMDATYKELLEERDGVKELI